MDPVEAQYIQRYRDVLHAPLRSKVMSLSPNPPRDNNSSTHYAVD